MISGPSGPPVCTALTYTRRSLPSPLTPSPPQLRPENKRRVLIYGVGGLGHQAVQLAKHLGQTVFAVDIRPDARALALKLGAEKAFHPGELQDIFAQQPASGQRFAVDVVFDFVAGTQCECSPFLPRGVCLRCVDG